jgi:uncharacterized SAM-binding protein YcdF (DUF218 family)
MTTAVLIHGHHLGVPDWEAVAWGDPPERPGIIPRGVAVAIEHDASFIFWGTGGSEKDGKKESEYAFDIACARVPEHAAFLTERSYLDRVTANTTEEVAACVKLCIEKGIGRLILVTAATHAERSLKEALAAESGMEIIAFPAATSYAGYGPGDVVVVEPPHRPDRVHSNLHELARRMVTLTTSKAVTRFVEDLDALLTKYGA